jgi:hypothetical protein
VSCRFLLPIQSLSSFLEISVGGKRRVPWSQLQQSRDDYIESKYLPEGVTLKQYYHLCKTDVELILEHWTERQAAGMVPLRFKKAATDIRKNTRTSDEDEDEDDGMPGESARKDPPGGGGHHTGRASAEDGRSRPNGSELPSNDEVRHLGVLLGLEIS